MIFNTRREWFEAFWYFDKMSLESEDFLKSDYRSWERNGFKVGHRSAPEVVFAGTPNDAYTSKSILEAVDNFLKSNLKEPYLTEYLSLDLIDKL